MIAKSRIIIFLVLGFTLSYCGTDPEKLKEEEKKLELSPVQKVEIAKRYLEIGLVSDAKNLFVDALPLLAKDDCKDEDWGKSCLYCDALYGKFLADFYGVLGTLGQLLEQLQEEEQEGAPVSPREKQKSENLLSDAIETILKTIIQKLDSQRQDLSKIIQENCQFQSSAKTSLKILSLEIFIPAKAGEDKEFIYSPLFAQMNYAVLSLIVGVVDILYSQNFSISAKETFDFLKKLLKLSEEGKPTLEILNYVGDFFVKNPELLTQNNQRVQMWSKSAKDFSDSLSNISQVLTKIENGCKNNKTNEATFTMLNSIVGSVVSSALPAASGSSGDLCSLLSLIRSISRNQNIVQEISGTLSRWARGFSGELGCLFEEIDQGGIIVKRIKRLPADDGCIRFPDDITRPIGGVLGSAISNFIPVYFVVRPADLFSVPNEQSPKNLRAILPLVKKEGDIFIFAIQNEPRANPFEGLELYTIERGAPEKILENVSFPKSCIASGKIFIPFADPTLFNSIYFYAECSADQTLNLGSKDYFQLPKDRRAGIYAINKLTSPLLSSLID